MPLIVDGCPPHSSWTVLTRKQLAGRSARDPAAVPCNWSNWANRADGARRASVIARANDETDYRRRSQPLR